MSKNNNIVGRQREETARKIAVSSLTERAYAAGLFDGEGCVAVYHRKSASGWQLSFRAAIANTDPRVLVWMLDHFGGKITRRGGARARQGRKETFTWYLLNARANLFFAAIRPFVRIKGEQIDLAARLQTTAKRGRKLGPGLIAQRNALVTEISEWKRKRFALEHAA